MRGNVVERMISQGHNFSSMLESVPMLDQVAGALKLTTPTANQFRFNQSAEAAVADIRADAARLGQAAALTDDPATQNLLLRQQLELMRSASEAQNTHMRVAKIARKMPWSQTMDMCTNARPRTLELVEAITDLPDGVASSLFGTKSVGAAAAAAGPPAAATAAAAAFPPPPVGAAAAAAVTVSRGYGCLMCTKTGHNWAQCPDLATLRRANDNTYKQLVVVFTAMQQLTAART
eukprot:XP_001699145.1 predicted protein [Chlamydomonas reinhardtii]